MKIKRLVLFTAAILLCSCSSNPLKGSASIDWVDFVKLNGNSYTGSWESVMKNPEQVTTEVLGEVKFKVSDVVTNPDYKTKDGDAAFLEKGTKLYRVEGFKSNEVIAAINKKRIGGFHLYVEDGFSKNVTQHYKDVIKNNVERVELYHQDDVIPYKTLANDEKKRFIHLLESGKNTKDYIPQNKDGDPEYYKVVFYTDKPFAFVFSLVDDGVNVFFSPWETRIVDIEIRTLLQP